MDTTSIPVLLIVFNRPDLAAKVFARIREMRPAQLFIAADGPRADRPGEEAICRETRAVTATVDWPCEVHRLERDANLGCKLAVSSAITWFFEYVEEGVILEDDCLPEPSFFRYCAELLEKYRNVPEVAMISGNNFQVSPMSESYYFTRYPQIWGWASWKRFWQHYDVEIREWNGDPNALDCTVPNARVRRYFAKKFDAVKRGEIDTWDYQVIHLCLSRSFVCINPSRNLVENIGFDERATHTVSTGTQDPMPAAEVMGFPLLHPPAIVVDERADRHTETYVRGIPPNLMSSLIRSLKKRLRKTRIV